MTNSKPTRRRRRGLRVLLATAVPLVTLSAVTALPAAADTPTRVALPSPNAPNLIGTPTPLDATTQLPLRVYLAPRPGLAAAAAALSDPRNPFYGHYLTAAQYQQQFGAGAQSAAVSDWLTAQGMTITATTPHYLAVTATVAQADTAFATQISEYDATVTEFGQTFVLRTPGVVGGFSVPAALGGDVLSVTGIDQINLPPTSSAAAAAVVPTAVKLGRSRTVRPRQATAHAADTTGDFQCSQYWGQYTSQIPAAYGQTTAPAQLCGYTPDQLRQAYGISTSHYTGKGATIAILSSDYHTTMLADANTFFANHGEAGFAPGQFSDLVLPTVADSCAGFDIEPDPEEPIDVESAHMAAPDAKILNVATNCAETTPGFLETALDGATSVVDQRLADIISGSFGIQDVWLPPSDLAPWDAVFEQGAVEGIGFDFSTGDSGDIVGVVSDPTSANVHNAQFPASDPWATAVGGTSMEIGQNGGVLADYAWGDNTADFNTAGTGYNQALPGPSTGGSGGGISTVFPEPGYQKPVVPVALATDNGTGAPSRVLPDISADAGNLWLIGYTGAVTDNVYNEIPEGGATSGSCPFVAGLEADAIQALGHPLGFANPAMYRLNGSAAIRDILPVDPSNPPIVRGEQEGFGPVLPNELVSLGEDTTLTTARGFDDSTGLGDPTKSFVTSIGRR